MLADVSTSTQAASMLRQHRTVTEAAVHQTLEAEAHSNLERAMRSLAASPDDLRRPGWPTIVASGAQLLPYVANLPRLHSSPSPAVLCRSADSDAGSQTITAFRIALQLRESKLLQAQRDRGDPLLQAADDTAEPPHRKSQSGQPYSHPMSTMPGGASSPQQPPPHRLEAESTVHMRDGVGGERTSSMPDTGEGSDPAISSEHSSHGTAPLQASFSTYCFGYSICSRQSFDPDADHMCIDR